MLEYWTGHWDEKVQIYARPASESSFVFSLILPKSHTIGTIVPHTMKCFPSKCSENTLR